MTPRLVPPLRFGPIRLHRSQRHRRSDLALQKDTPRRSVLLEADVFEPCAKNESEGKALGAETNTASSDRLLGMLPKLVSSLLRKP